MDINLNKLVRKYAESTVESLGKSKQYSKDAREEVINVLCDQWRAQIKREIVDELTEEEKEKIDKRIQEHRTKRDIENLRTLVWEGIFLAVVIGVLVNQITDIITYLKDGQYSITITWIIILALVVCVWGYVLFRLAAIISKLLGKKENDDESNS